jgi:hypothetical protein
VTVTATVATFTKETLLDECDDLIIMPPPGVDAGSGFLDGFVESMVKGKTGASRVYKPCDEQFRTNAPLDADARADSGAGAMRGHGAT